MSTPMIGGAERLLRDLLYGIDKDKYEINLFYESWSEFDAFLALQHHPEIASHPLRIFEPGGHILSTGQISDIRQQYSLHAAGVKVIALLKKIHERYNPFRRQTGELLMTLANFLCFGANMFYLYKAFRKSNIGILHIINGGYPGAVSAREAAVAAKMANVPVCLMTVCTSPTAHMFPKFVEYCADKVIRKCVDKYIVPADNVGRLLTELRGIDFSKISIIPWGVPVAEYLLTEEDRTRLCQELGIPRAVKIFGNIARFEPRKGHRYLIEAAAILAKKRNDFHVILVGDGTNKKEMVELVKSLGLESLITFAGYRPDTGALTQMFDVFAYPSILEGLPISLLEAMSYGKPIVATPADGIREAILNNVNGLIVAPENPIALAAAIGKLMDDPDLSRRMGAAAQKRFTEQYSMEKMLKKNELLYGSCAIESRSNKK